MSYSFSPSGTYKTFNATDLLFNSNFSQSPTLDGKFIPLQSCRSMYFFILAVL